MKAQDVELWVPAEGALGRRKVGVVNGWRPRSDPDQRSGWSFIPGTSHWMASRLP